jgi:hypothetical protein
VGAAVAVMILAGLARQVELGRNNLRFDLTRESFYPDIEASQWLQRNAPESAVVMARQLPVVYYHCGRRRTIWFPPITDVSTLMDGIRRYGIRYVVVVEGRRDSYFLPPEEHCFGPLVSTYPGAFRLVHLGPNNRVYEVVPNTAGGPAPRTT